MSGIQTIFGSIFGTGQGVRSNNGISSRILDDPGYCNQCEYSGKNQRKTSCCMFLFLLAVDALTIGLLLMLFYNTNHPLNADGKKTFRNVLCIQTTIILKTTKW